MKRLGCLILTIAMTLWLLIPAAQAQEAEYPGKSYLLMDAATGTVLQSHNEHEPLAPASVTKVMTLLLIMEAIDSGSIQWDTPVTASEAAAAKGGSQVYLKVGETMTVEEMVKSIAVSSANDCACAMAELLAGSEEAFVQRMNEKAKQLGMEDTHFVNCTGLDDGADADAHRTSAYDIALMSRQLLTKHPDIKKFTTIWMDSVRGGSFGLSNTNKLIRFYPGATGLKTGFTSGAGYCLSASALRDGMELIAVVMGCQTSADRFDTCRKMLDYGFASYTLYEAPAPEDASVPVRLGESSQVELVPQTPARLLIRKDEASRMRTEVSLPQEIPAPVDKDAPLGQMRILCGDELRLEIPLIARQSVMRKDFAQIFFQILSQTAMGAPESFPDFR